MLHSITKTSLFLSLISFLFFDQKVNKNFNCSKQDPDFKTFPQHVESTGLHSALFENPNRFGI